MFDFKLATVFCLGYRLSKHKITTYFKKLWGAWPRGPPWLRLWFILGLRSQPFLCPIHGEHSIAVVMTFHSSSLQFERITA